MLEKRNAYEAKLQQRPKPVPDLYPADHPNAETSRQRDGAAGGDGGGKPAGVDPKPKVLTGRFVG